MSILEKKTCTFWGCKEAPTRYASVTSEKDSAVRVPVCIVHYNKLTKKGPPSSMSYTVKAR